MAKQKKASLEFFILFGLILLFYNNIVSFLASFGFTSAFANLFILLAVGLVAYRYTPWLNAIVRGKI